MIIVEEKKNVTTSSKGTENKKKASTGTKKKKTTKKKTTSTKKVKKNTTSKQKVVNNTISKQKNVEIGINEFLKKKDSVVAEHKIETFTKPTTWESIKKFSKKRKLLIAIIIFIILFVVCFCSFIKLSNSTSKQGLTPITMNKYKELYTSDDFEYIYLYDKSLGDSATVQNNLYKLQKEFNIEIYKLNDLLNYKNPTLIIVKNGKTINSISASKEYNVLKKFVTEADKEEAFSSITVNKYMSLINNNTLTLIYIGNSYCNDFSLVLGNAIKNRKIDVNYLDLDNISDSEDWDKLNNSFTIFNDLWFTPVLLLVKDGNIVDYKMEKMDLESINEFFDKNGVK